MIETPATPLPWINYLGNEDFFSLISNTGGGYSFYKDAKLRRITRYRYNNVPAAQRLPLLLPEPDGLRFRRCQASRNLVADLPSVQDPA